MRSERRLQGGSEADLRRLAIQILALVAQGLNASIDLLPGRGKFWAMVGLSAVQGLTAVLAHFANPDGTPAEAPYIKK